MSDLSRQADRLEWARRMLEKGLPVARAGEQRAGDSGSAGLSASERSQLALANYQRFTAPKQVLTLQSQVIGAQSTLNYQSIRLAREQERLAHYKKLVDGCTIRAPHGGLLIYANRPGREPSIYAGATVRERMPLFTIPDPSRLEVEVMLHETAVQHVRTGMSVHVGLEALPEVELAGEVESIAPVPISDRNPQTGNDIAYFLAHVRLGAVHGQVTSRHERSGHDHAWTAAGSSDRSDHGGHC